jgi:cyclase
MKSEGFRVNTGILIVNMEPFLSRKFQPYMYLGNPRNALDIFSDFDYSELIVLNKNNKMNKELIEFFKSVARGIRSPICIGGQIISYEDAKILITGGYERIILQSIFWKNYQELQKISNIIGKQSLSFCIDFYDTTEGNFILKNGIELKDFIRENYKSICENFGELILNNITRNGTMVGLPSASLLIELREILPSINLIYSGGISANDDIRLLNEYKYDGCICFSYSTLTPDLKNKLLNNNARKNIKNTLQQYKYCV